MEFSIAKALEGLLKARDTIKPLENKVAEISARVSAKEPRCPWCGDELDAEFTDNGVGLEKTSPYECVNCQALELDPTKPVPPGVEVRDGFSRGDPEIDGQPTVEAGATMSSTPIHACDCTVLKNRAEAFKKENESLQDRLRLMQDRLRLMQERVYDKDRQLSISRSEFNDAYRRLQDRHSLDPEIRKLKEQLTAAHMALQNERGSREAEFVELRKKLNAAEEELVRFRGRLGQQVENTDPTERFKNLEID